MRGGDAGSDRGSGLYIVLPKSVQHVPPPGPPPPGYVLVKYSLSSEEYRDIFVPRERVVVLPESVQHVLISEITLVTHYNNYKHYIIKGEAAVVLPKSVQHVTHYNNYKHYIIKGERVVVLPKSVQHVLITEITLVTHYNEHVELHELTTLCHS